METKAIPQNELNKNNQINIPVKTAATKSFAAIYENTTTNKTKYYDIFLEASQKYNIPVNILQGVAKAESNFNPLAVSNSGARGIMQLMPATAKSLGVEDSFNPKENIFGGAKYLRNMLDIFNGDLELALAAYNAGPGNVKKYRGIPPFKETQKYVPKVLAFAGELGANPTNLDLTAAKVKTTQNNLANLYITPDFSNLDKDYFSNQTGTDFSAEQILLTLALNMAFNTKSNFI